MILKVDIEHMDVHNMYTSYSIAQTYQSYTFLLYPTSHKHINLIPFCYTIAQTYQSYTFLVYPTICIPHTPPAPIAYLHTHTHTLSRPLPCSRSNICTRIDHSHWSLALITRIDVHNIKTWHIKTWHPSALAMYSHTLFLLHTHTLSLSLSLSLS